MSTLRNPLISPVLKLCMVNYTINFTKIGIAMMPAKRITNWNTSVHTTLLMPPCNIGTQNVVISKRRGYDYTMRFPTKCVSYLSA